MKKGPWVKWYWTDWRGDPKLRMCSIAARGLWAEMLALMQEAVPYGHLLISGRAPTDMQLGVLAGVPEDQVTPLLGELETHGVFSRTRAGVIYSRRMVRDEKKTKTAQKNGKSGGNPSLCQNKENQPSDNPQVKPQDNTQKPEAKKPDKDADEAGDPLTAISDLLWEAGGQALNRTSTGLMVLSRPIAWLEEGCDMEADILPAIRAAGARASPQSIRSWKYFDQAVADAKARRLAPMPEGRCDERPDTAKSRDARARENHLVGIQQALAARRG